MLKFNKFSHNIQLQIDIKIIILNKLKRKISKKTLIMNNSIFFVAYYFSNKLPYFSFDYTVDDHRLSVNIYFFNYFMYDILLL